MLVKISISAWFQRMSCSTAFNSINESTFSWYFIMKSDYMSGRAFYRTLHNSCFCHLISFRTTLSMIHVKKACRYIFPRLFVVLPLRPLVHNGSTFVCCRVQSPVCHSQKMMAETREAIIIFHFYRFSLHAAWVILNNQESIFVQIWSSFGQHLWIKNFFCKINLSIFSP